MLCWVRGGRFRFHNKQTKKVDSGPFDFHCRLLQFLKNENVESHQHSGRWFCLLNLRLPSGIAFGEIARWQAGAQTWTQTWTRPPDQRVVKVLKPPKSQHSKLCGVWILFKYVTDTKFEPSEVTFLRLMPHTVWMHLCIYVQNTCKSVPTAHLFEFGVYRKPGNAYAHLLYGTYCTSCSPWHTQAIFTFGLRNVVNFTITCWQGAILHALSTPDFAREQYCIADWHWAPFKLSQKSLN